MNRLITLTCLAAIAAAGCGGERTTPHPTTSTTTPASTTKPSSGGDEPATRPILGLPAGWELAPRATCSATQRGGEVVITATGENPTAGYEVKLFQSPLRIWPPQWMLARKKPDGLVAQVITPFEVTASFKAGEPVKQVVVSDAAGRREVKVEQAGD